MNIKKIFTISFCAFLGSVTGACSEMPRELWIATKHIAVYASETDGEEVILFQLKPGDVCTPLREVAIKVYLHSEILCEKGKGWVIDKTSFDVRKAD